MVAVAPSNRHRVITGLLALASLQALALCGLPPAPFAALVLAVLALAAHELAAASRRGVVTLVRGGVWRLEGFGLPPFEGVPVPDGYRGSAALVLVLERTDPARPVLTTPTRTERLRSARARGADRSPRRRLLVHADSVSGSDFSLLHLHLALPDGGEP